MADVLADSGVFLLLHPSPHGGIRSKSQRYRFVSNASGFTRWLMQQIGRKDPIGDLARDVQFDTAWTSDLDSLEMALRVIEYATEEVKLVVEEAWNEYATAEPTSTYSRDVEEWFRDNTEPGRTGIQELWEDYGRWCRARSYRIMPIMSFSQRLNKMGYTTAITHIQGVSTRTKKIGLISSEAPHEEDRDF